MGFEDTLSVFLAKNTTLAKIKETPLVKKARELGIDTATLDEKDIGYAIEQYRLQIQLF